LSLVARCIAAVLALCAFTRAQAQDEVSVICSEPLNWCEATAGAFSRETGIGVRLTLKAPDAALAQVTFERAQPHHDVWFGGAYEGHRRAAELGLTARYKSPLLPQLFDWAVRTAEHGDFHNVAIYASVAGFAYNHVALAKKHLAAPRCWSDLGRSEYAGGLLMSDPYALRAGYEAIVALVQMFGEARAFDLLKAIAANVAGYPHTRAGAVRGAARGEALIAITFLHDAVAEIADGFPITLVVPCEGAGYDMGAMSIIDGGPNTANAQKFYDWALTPSAQRIGAATRNFQTPSNRSTPTVPAAPPTSQIRLVPYDFARHGDAQERARLLTRWERDARSH